MRPQSSRQAVAKQVFQRINKAAGELNAFLMVIAIGLAALDLTCLYALTLEKAMPPITEVNCPADQAPAAK